MAGSSLFSNLARAAKVLALLLFLLPWVTVSCSQAAMNRAAGQAGASGGPAMPASSDIPLAKGTGLQLATGSVSMVTDGMPQREGGPPAPDLKAELGVIVGAVLILLALAASFLLKGGMGAVAAIAGCVLAVVALCYSVFMHVPQMAREAFAASGNTPGGGSGGPSSAQLAEIIQVRAEIGFWLTILALVAAIVLNFMAMRKPGAVAAPVAAPPPSPPPPVV
jgi:hypothetical protein